MASSVTGTEAASDTKPKVLFVLGGPGAGKGTQCAKVVEEFGHWSHISAGDCLRAERNDPNSKDGELINNIIKEGKIVPSEITVGLLVKAMAKQKEDGKKCFLIDGFPRNLGNDQSWEQVVGDGADVLGVLFYEASEVEMEKRLLERGTTSGRVDDNIESIKKRFRTYLEETMPIVEKYEKSGLVYKINGMPPPDEVWSITKATIQRAESGATAQAEPASKPRVLFVLGGPGAGKGTQCAKIVERFQHWSHISAGDCLRAERNDPASKDGELINSIIKEGKIVPSEITVGLLVKAMAKQKEDGKTCFLIDGFPRNLGNDQSWNQVVGTGADVLGVLFYEAAEGEMEKRLLGRGATSGRVDDNIESIRKRFKTYLDETMPIVEKYEANGLVYKINGMPPPEEVWAVTEATIQKAEAKAA